MRSGLLLMSLVSFMLLGLGLSIPAAVTAQDASPASEEEFPLPEGVTFEFIGAGEATSLPAGPIDVQLFRIGLEPGASLSLEPDDPSTALVSIEAGSVTFTVDAKLTVLRAASDVEMIPAGQEFTLEAGDSVVFPPRVPGEVRNDGDEPASLLIANLFPLEESELATPAA